MNDSNRTALYRLYDSDDNLLYIGITKRARMRWYMHAAEKPWWPQVERRTMDWYDSRPEAEDAEVAAIGAEHPRYNIMYTEGGPQRRGGSFVERDRKCRPEPTPVTVLVGAGPAGDDLFLGCAPDGTTFEITGWGER